MNTITENLLWEFPHCPSTPNEQIDWDAILAKFPSLYGLERCEQNPLYHAEGNVWIHTKLVCEALVLCPVGKR
jgi:hypothetical protein